MTMIDSSGESGESGYDPEAVLDKVAIESEIAAGARAFTKLLNHAADDWTSWSITIIGLRGLRTLACAEAQTSDIQSHAYRQAMTALLKLRKYSVYDQIGKETRSICYKLMDCVEEITVWYASLPPADKLKWKHPQSIMKHAPQHLIANRRGHNKPVKKDPKKKVSASEIERLRALLVKVIKLLSKYEPETAMDLLHQVAPDEEPDPDDELGEL